MSTTVEDTIEVEVPLRTAYNAWTQFETFPKFMDGVQEVRQLDPTHLHWKAKIAGAEREWDAEITDQLPDQRVAWAATAGAANAGVVTFQPTQDAATKITLRLEFDPEGFAEKAADVLGLVEHRAKGDLKRFKEYIEAEGTEPDGWRGSVAPHQP